MNDKRILVVDDDQTIVEVLESILDEEGYAVLHSYSGIEAIQIAKQRKPHLILLDLMLPDLHGKVVAQELRDEQAVRQIPILVISAARDAKDIAKTMDVQGCIEKPFQLDNLLSMVAQLVSD